jgi:hypothetical protein
MLTEATLPARIGGAVGAVLWLMTLLVFLSAERAFLHDAHDVAAVLMFLCIVGGAVDNAADTKRAPFARDLHRPSRGDGRGVGDHLDRRADDRLAVLDDPRRSGRACSIRCVLAGPDRGTLGSGHPLPPRREAPAVAALVLVSAPPLHQTPRE